MPVLILIFFSLFFPACAIGQATSAPVRLPGCVSDLELGMSTTDFFHVRPKIKKKYDGDPEAPDVHSQTMFLEEFSNCQRFGSAIYMFPHHRLAAVILYAYPRQGDIRKTRRAIITEAQSLWGAPASKRLYTMTDGTGDVPHVPGIKWSLPTARVDILSLSPGKPPLDAHTILTILDNGLPASMDVRLTDENAVEKDRATAFRSAGLE